jgi:hypothetical protein
MLFVDVECGFASEDEQVSAVAADDVAQRFENRPPRAEDAGLSSSMLRSRHASITREVAQTWCANVD